MTTETPPAPFASIDAVTQSLPTTRLPRACGSTPGARPCSWPSSCSARCCWRASPAWARPSWPRRSRRRWRANCCGSSATTGSSSARRSTNGTTPQLLHMRAAEARGASSDVEIRGLPAPLPGAPAKREALQAPAAWRGAADRRSRWRRRSRYEAFLLEYLTRIPGQHSRTWHRARDGAAGDHPHQQPHARAQRRGQAPLPLSLARPVERANANMATSCAPRRRRRRGAVGAGHHLYRQAALPGPSTT